MTREEAIKELKIFSGTTRIRLSANFWEALNTVIKALEQETCEDAVSRSEIQQKINRLWNSNGDKNYCMETLKDFVTELQPVTPAVCIAKVTFNKDDLQELAKEKIKEITVEQRWIPVKERLPETDGEYLLFGRIDESEEYYKFIGTFDAGAEEFGIWQECFDDNTLGCIGSEFYEYDEVLAWMPLPEDYKKENEE